MQAILKTPVEQADLGDFAASGGKVRYVFRELSYGWIGTIAADKRGAQAEPGQRRDGDPEPGRAEHG